MTLKLIQWIKRFTISYAYTVSHVAPKERADVAQARAAFEERLANTEARLQRLDVQAEVMEKPRGSKPD